MDKSYFTLQVGGWVLTTAFDWVDGVNLGQTALNALAWSVIAVVVEVFYERWKSKKKSSSKSKSE